MEAVKIDDTGYYLVHNKVMVVQEIEGTKDFNFIYNNVCIAVALLQAGEYYLYFFDSGYGEKEVNLCFESLKLLNENLKQEKIC